jgi:hypothetical protein
LNSRIGELVGTTKNIAQVRVWIAVLIDIDIMTIVGDKRRRFESPTTRRRSASARDDSMKSPKELAEQELKNLIAHIGEGSNYSFCRF